MEMVMICLQWASMVPLILLLNLSPSYVTANLITDTCQKTPHVALCISSLGVDPRSTTADVKGLAEIILEETLANARDILVHKVEYFANRTTDPTVRECLATCDVLYGLITGSTIPDAIGHVAVNKYDVALGNANDAAQEVDACEGSFGGKSVASPLTSWNSAVKNFAEIAAGIISLLSS